ncbi:GGDEF domain-containing response regulator [Lignipirellula cremea]|uniref:diguanylate cyclase n=1 Tax=Lignipirellula cremea TaxID=2528010 RepID=A0A518E4W9_9BACT|nr:diguanylate cyclase [Lignipirellula cremea]QDU99132.1 Response regulator PleD [Lignipirellula cremea]
MKVLIADDELVALRLLESSLRRWGYDVVVARNGNEASQILLSPDAPKLAILDWRMPGMDGTQLCQEIRQNKPEPYTYVILLSGNRDQDDIIAGLDAGADDYVTKPFDPAELRVRLRTGKRILCLQEQLINSREAMRDLATRDGLTGLWNRSAILDIIEGELARALRQGVPVAVIMADLDCFKLINDTYGHATGDAVLQKAAQVMRDSVRRYDSVGRYGGEEFLLVLPGCDPANAIGHAERVRAAIAQIDLPTPKGNVRPTVSLGVAVSSIHSASDPYELIQTADVALYRAKDGGRNRAELAAAEPGICTR